MPKPSTPAAPAALDVKRRPGEIWSHLRKKWLIEKPEERVRQDFVCVLVNEYGYALDQMDEERHVAVGNLRERDVVA